MSSYSLFKSRFKKSITEAIFNEVTGKTARYYHWIGKENTWTDFLSPFISSSTTDNPGEPQDNFRYDLHVRRDILTAKAISSSDVAFVVPRYDWASGTIYDMYDDAITANEPAYSGATKLETAKFYVITTEYNVYKCISNNYNSKSTVTPSGTSSTSFSTADGYIWKFMYTIPISLRNRFLSNDYMPVSTAIKNQFYSNGAITSVTIESGGTGYIAQINGAGQVYITSAAPTALVGVATGNYPTKFSTQLKAGYIVKYYDSNSALQTIGTISSVTNDYAAVLSANYTGTTIPSGTPVSYIIVPPDSNVAKVTVSGDGYLKDDPYSVKSVTIVNAGAGYGTGAAGSAQALPTLAVTAPTAVSTTMATTALTPTISSGALTGVTFTNYGKGYESTPIVTIDPPLGVGISNYTYFIANTAYTTLNAVVLNNGQFYRVSTITAAGQTSGSTGPTHTSGVQSNGTGNLQFTYLGPQTWAKNTFYDQYAIINAGGYYYYVSNSGGGTSSTSSPASLANPAANNTNGTLSLTYFGTQASVTLVTQKNEAIMTPIVSDAGQIVGITITDAGVGYTNANIQVVDYAHPATATPNTTYASITPNLFVGNVDTLQANVELLAVNGAIEFIKVVNTGTGYTTATVTIQGDGTGATARAVIVGGRITRINIITKGVNYTWTNVIITGSGINASARAIMSPVGGHGKNAIDELNASSLMFYSSFSRIKNQGMIISNDYRKAGLIKNIKKFNSKLNFTADTGSGCILINAAAGTTFDISKLDYDMLLQKKEASGSNYKNYRVVEFNTTQILLSVFNNFEIAAGDVLVNPSGYEFIVPNAAGSIVPREIDPFSGDLLFFTVREPFAPSTEQIITLRTVVTL